jgi:TatD DNase family protein
MCETPYIDIHTHHSCNADGILYLLNCFPEQGSVVDHADKTVSVGLHPWHVGKDNASSIIDLIQTSATYENVLAIGEIGLDRTTDTALSVQEMYFLKQIQIAESLNKPIIIHCVRCFPDILSIKKRVKASTPWLIHGFRNSNQIANDLIKQNCYLSFGEALLFDKKNQDIFIEMPLERVFLETDESEISISKIYTKAAHLKGLPLEVLKERLFNNYKTVFMPSNNIKL